MGASSKNVNPDLSYNPSLKSFTPGITNNYLSTKGMESNSNLHSMKNTEVSKGNKNIPLKSRKMTDDEKNNNLVNKIFNINKIPKD